MTWKNMNTCKNWRGRFFVGDTAPLQEPAPANTTVVGGSDGAITLRSDGERANLNVRLDHCHFAQLYQGKIVRVNGWTYGVADHNFMELRTPPGSQAFFMNEATYSQKTNG